jgi:hypothetical protein
MSIQEVYKKETGYEPKMLVCNNGCNNSVHSKQYVEWLEMKLERLTPKEEVTNEN